MSKAPAKITEAELVELLDLLNQCTGIGIKHGLDVTITFADIFAGATFFDRLHKAISRRWHP